MPNSFGRRRPHGPRKRRRASMNQAIKRSIFRWIHIIFAIPILGYIYSPFDKIPQYAPATRFVFVPLLVLSGLWMWKGHLVRRLVSRKPPQQAAPAGV